MSQDLSSLSISSLQETESIISDRSLIMEDVFDIYDSYSIASSNTNSIIGSLRLGLRSHSEQDLYSLSNTSSAALSPSKAPLSALERLQLEQKRRSQEQERLAEIVLPSGKSKQGGPPTSQPSVLPTREIPRELMPPAHSFQVAPLPSLPSPTQQQQNQLRQEPGPMMAAIHDAAMYDQLLTLASGPNRPRLPSQLEWQRGIEELRQKRKDQATATNSVGRQNSTGSRHSQDSSADGKSRRHSMPDMPHGQREDRDRRGDGFRNPMLLNQSQPGAAGLSGGGQKRRSGYEDREQQLQQPPIQQQSILESQVMDTSVIPRLVSTPEVGPAKAKKKAANSKRPEISVPDQYIPRDDAGRRVVSPVDITPEKDAVDMAFDEMLASLSLSAGTRAQLESLPKDRKWAMLQSNDANPTLYHTPQTMPPQFFVDALLEYSGKRKRLSKDQYQQQQKPTGVPSSGATNKPTGMLRNQSATNLSLDPQQQSLQQQLLAMLGKSDRRILEEREQVLKKLRVLIRNGSIRWTGEFIKAGGPHALLEFGQYVQRTEENKLGQRDRLLHQVVQCIKAIVPLEGGITSLVQESMFYSLMRTLSILEAPVLASKSKDSSTLLGTSPTSGTKVKTGFFAGNRTRSSSIPKPMPTRFGYQTSFQSTPALTADQIPTFSNSTAAVNILTSVLSRVPELRDSVLKESIADPVPPSTTSKWVIDTNWTYSEWIAYLREILHLCGIESLPAFADNGGVNGTTPSKIIPVGAGLASMGSGPSGSSLSIFSLDMRRRRHTSSSPAPSPSGGIKYDAEEDREVLAYLTAHLELVSKLMFDMHMSSPVLAFAKSVKESRLGELLERLRSQYIRDQSLSAQVEDILIQLSMIPSTTRLDASLLARELPVIPPMEAYDHQLHHQSHITEHSLQPRPSSQQYYYSTKTDAKYDAQVSLKVDTPLRNSSMEASSRKPSTQGNQRNDGSPRVQTKVKVSLSSPNQEGANSPRTRKAVGQTDVNNNNTSLAKQISITRVSETSQDGRATPEEYRPRSSTPSKGNPRRPSSTDPASSYALGSRLPVIPPKSKHRAMSQDPKEVVFTRSESPLVHGSDLHKQHHRRQTLDVLTLRSPEREQQIKDENVLTSSPRSINTFGHGRRSSLNHSLNKNFDSPLLSLQDTCTDSSSSSSSGDGDSRRNSSQNTQADDRQTMILDAPIPPYLRAHQPSSSADGSSSCSSTTSSGFTVTSSTSSVSPPATQTRKHSLLVGSSEGENLSSMGSKFQAITRSDTRSSSKDPSRYNDVDFDIQIHQDVVRQLISSSSTKGLSEQMHSGQSIEASDPLVLMAPIIVPEDMALMREQYIQSQISGIILPPLEMKKDTVGDQPSLGGGVQRSSSSSGHYHHHNYNRSQLPPQPQVLVPFSHASSSSSVAPHLPPKAGARRVSGNSTSHIPVLTASANLGSVGDGGQYVHGRRKSIDPSPPSPGVSIPVRSSLDSAVNPRAKKVSDRIKMFERS
ncbi:hypothetical protein BG005_010347 [Podila minutissima]|nr:hypothetical protein BG005_010347 [Podila minutissima]